MSRTGGQILVDQLRIHGVDTVFCVPGESYIAALDALGGARDEIRLIVCRQEGGAANMAEAYGKLTGKPGICFVTRGPGATNASIGVHTAFQDSTPMILLMGQVARDARGREAFQEVDVDRVFDGQSKWAAEIDDPARLPELVARAFTTAVSGRPGPVVLALPEDMLAEECDTVDAWAYRRVQAHPGASDLARMRDLLEGAERPLAIVGGGGWTEGASDDLRAFVEANGLPTGASFRCQDYLDNRSPLYVGDVGLAINPALAQRVRDADLLIAIGSRLGESTTSGYTLLDIPRPKQRLVHVHPGIEELGRVYQADVAIASGLPEFCAAARTLEPVDASRWAGWAEAARADYLAHSRPLPAPGAVNVSEIVAYLADRLPDDAIVTNGAGNYTVWAHRFYRFRRYRTQLAPTSGAMGYGVPAAVAAKVVHPDRTVVCFSGDGDFLMNGQELATAVPVRASGRHTRRQQRHVRDDTHASGASVSRPSLRHRPREPGLRCVRPRVRCARRRRRAHRGFRACLRPGRRVWPARPDRAPRRLRGHHPSRVPDGDPRERREEISVSKILIRGAHVLTMDDGLGTIPDGDVLIEGNRIAGVGVGLDASGAEVIDGRDRIVLPGFVDTHRHMWAAMLRGCACYGDLSTYFHDVVFTYGANFTPDDTHASITFGLAEAIDSGITTLHAWEHNLQTREHADAAIAAFRESGMRGRFSYGPSSDPTAGSSFAQGTETIDFEHVRELKPAFGGPDDLLHLGIACRGAEYSQPEIWQSEYAFAREEGLPFTTHTMMTRHDIERVRAITVYKEHGVLGPDHLLVHAIHADEDEIRALADTGTPVSVSIFSELRTGMGIPPVVAMLKAGVNVNFSLDTMAASDNSDMFATMRATMCVERGRYEDATVYQPDQVLRQATIDGAAALRLGDVTGSLTAGKRADVIMLRADDLNLAPLNVADGQVVLAAQPRNVDSVWIDGVAKKRDGELVGVDVPALVSKVKDAVAGLSARLERPVT